MSSTQYTKKIALIDCNSFYVSCERLFNPKIRNKPVVVLSSNDGCIISRSNEAKALGIKMGDPYFKAKDIILKNKGTVDKYIGDAIMAFYGAPVDLEDHEYRAVLSVNEMNKKLEELKEKWRNEGDKWPDLVRNMEHRVGINTGDLVTGNMGSELQMNYTCMGDTVNLAARLESGSKQWGINAQVAQSVYDKSKDNFIFRKLGGVRVKGKREPVNVYELLCQKGDKPKGLDKLLNEFEKARILYLKQDWDNAIKAFEVCDRLEDMSDKRHTNPSRTYIKICNEFKAKLPGEDWDGIYTFKEK